MNKIMRFVQPIRLAHVTSHTSTNLHQSSKLFTTTTTGLPWHPLPPSPLPPHHHLHDMSKHSDDSRNTPTTTPRHRDTPMTQTDHNGSKMRRTRPETEQRARGKGGEHAKDKGWKRTRYTCHFFKFLLHY